MMIARLSLLHNLPRLASTAPFLCLIVAQCEWPDMTSPLQKGARFRNEDRGRGAFSSPRCAPAFLKVTPHLWVSSRPHQLQFLLDLLVPRVGPPPRPRLEQRQRLAPRRRRFARFLLLEVDVAQVVPHHRIVV